MNLVFVYLGRKIPKYVLDNFRMTVENFPSHSCFFVSDNSIMKSKIESAGGKFFLISNPAATWKIDQNSMGYSPAFRDGFWYKTLARIYALERFALTHDEPFLHIESDVILSVNFPFSRFLTIQSQLAYPLTTVDQGVASTLFVKNHKAISSLLKFSEREISQNNMATDVTILGSYHQGNSDVMILPTAIPGTGMFTENTSLHNQQLVSNNFDVFSGIFDASTWGQFILGEDERNSLGFRRIGHIQNHHLVNPANYPFEVLDDFISIRFFEKQIPIFALHVHCKDRRAFRAKTLKVILNENICQIRIGELSKFHLRTFLILAPGLLRYLLVRVLRFNEKK